MRIQGPCTLKRRRDDTSEAIILTFASEWRTPILKEQVRVVFRKLGPSDFIPALMYVYVAAPDSAIIARAPILDYRLVDTDKAILLADEGQISREALAAYAKDRQELIVMRLGQIAVARSPITYERLSTQYNFWPSSTYIPLSESGRLTLDKLGDFASGSQGSRIAGRH